jgi:hypothetical protein
MCTGPAFFPVSSDTCTFEAACSNQVAAPDESDEAYQGMGRAGLPNNALTHL